MMADNDPGQSLVRPATLVLDQICVEGLPAMPMQCAVELRLEQSATFQFTVLKPDCKETKVVDPPSSRHMPTGTTRSLCSQDLCDVASFRSGNSRGGTASVRSYSHSMRSMKQSARTPSGRLVPTPSVAGSTQLKRTAREGHGKQVVLGQWVRATQRLAVGAHAELKVQLWDVDSQQLLIDDALSLATLPHFQKNKFVITNNDVKLLVSLELQPKLRPRSVIIKGFMFPELAKEKHLLTSNQYYLECSIGPHCTRMDFTFTDLLHTTIDPVTGECTLNHKTGPDRTILLELGCKDIVFKLVRKHILKADSSKGTATLPISALSPERTTVHSVHLGEASTLVLLLHVGYPIE